MFFVFFLCFLIFFFVGWFYYVLIMFLGDIGIEFYMDVFLNGNFGVFYDDVDVVEGFVFVGYYGVCVCFLKC